MGYDDNNNQQQQPTTTTPLNSNNYMNGPMVNDGFNVAPNTYQYMPIQHAVLQNNNTNNNNNSNNSNTNNNNNNNSSGNYQAYYGYPGQQYQQVPPPPPGYYQAYVPANGAIITSTVSSHNSCDDDSIKECKNRGYFHAEEVTGALIIFLCGFLLSCVWLGGCIYFRSKNSTARLLGILSVVLFTVSTIAAIVIISVIFTQAGNIDFSSSSENGWN